MNESDLPHELEKALAEYRGAIVAAELRDEQDQALAAGHVTLTGRTFWPRGEKAAKNLSRRAARLRMYDGTVVSIEDCDLCSIAGVAVHYHFRLHRPKR